MNKKILVAGAAGALLFGAAAIAQTNAGSNQPGAAGANENTYGNDRANSAGTYGSDASSVSGATTAGEYGTDASGTAMDRAGERG